MVAGGEDQIIAIFLEQQIGIDNAAAQRQARLFFLYPGDALTTDAITAVTAIECDDVGFPQ